MRKNGNRFSVLIARIDERTAYLVETVKEIKDKISDYPEIKTVVKDLKWWKNKILGAIVLSLILTIVGLVIKGGLK